MSAMAGTNLAARKGPEAAALGKWYSGPTLTDLLGKLLSMDICLTADAS